MKKLLVATRNHGKVEEMKTILKKLEISGYEIVGLDEVEDIPADFDVEETGATFTENAISKAREYGNKAGMLTLADDSGLVVKSLGGRPGVLSARYGKTDGERCQKLLEEMSDVPDRERQAHFICVMALYDPNNVELNTFDGEYGGKIARETRGTNGFGFDSVFYNEDLDKTNAEMTPEEKNLISHRRMALQQVGEFLNKI